jgi:hypothetical protein
MINKINTHAQITFFYFIFITKIYERLCWYFLGFLAILLIQRWCVYTLLLENVQTISKVKKFKLNLKGIENRTYTL